MKNKFSIAITLAVLMAMLVTSLALADVVTSDVDFVATGNQTLINLGTVAPNQVVNTSTSFQLVCSGKNHADQGNTVFVNYFSAAVLAGSLTAGNTTIGPIPGSWADDSGDCISPAPIFNDNGNSAVTITAPAAAGTYDYVVTYKVCQSNDDTQCGGIDPNDVSGSIPPVTFRLTVAGDTTAPLITKVITGTAGTNGWYTSNVTVAWTVTDPDSAVVIDSGCGTQNFTTETTGTASSCAAHSAGGSSSDSVTVNIDKTAPTISAAPTTIPNSAGWYNSNVTVSFSCSDGTSGVASCGPDQTLSSDGAGQSATGNASDNAGNSASMTVSGINIDKTAPTASASASPAANANGWNNSDVSVTFSGSDALSGIDFCDAAAVLSSEGAGQSASGTCTDKAGNVSASATASGINIDKTAPTASASASPAANTNGWNKTDVTVSFSGNDGSGSGIDFCDAAVVLSAEGAGQSASGDCTDKAGNVSASATASNINIDKTNPSVSLVGGPADGASYYFGSVPAAPGCNASDGLSGINGSCSVSGYGTTVGSHTVTASASDNAGNSNSVSATYTVLAWTLGGFYQPVDMGGVWNTVKGGSTVPLKFEVFAGTTELTSTSVVKSFAVTGVACNSSTADDIELTTTGGTSLRYDTTAGQFIQNWQTPRAAGSCYRVTMTTQDGSFLSALFKLK